MGLKVVAPLIADGESDLIAACLRGEQTAERALFRREYPRVNATVFRILGSTREADDVVQDTFVAVFRALPRFRGESKISTWIDRIAVRMAFQYIAARKRQPALMEQLPQQSNVDGTPHDRAHAREGLRRLYHALALLKPDARTAFALYAIDGRSIAEVASLTSVTALTAKVRIWRARRAVARFASADPVLADYLAAAEESSEP